MTTATLKPIRKRAATLELTEREMQVVSRLLFAGMVELMREIKQYRDIPAHDAFHAEAMQEKDTIRRAQMKIDGALADLD